MPANPILLALDRLHPGGYEGLDPAQPTPWDYDEYLAALREGETPYSEATMIAAAAAQQAEDRAALAAPTPASRLAALGGIYDGLPDEVQHQFADAFVAVMCLVERDRLSMARGYVARLTVPSELEPVREEILQSLSE
jgi:hypothetical protein